MAMRDVWTSVESALALRENRAVVVPPKSSADRSRSQASLEVVGSNGRQMIVLSQDGATIGQSESNDVSIEGDRTLSHFHAVLERYAPGWCIRDVGSRNGTFVNGERILSQRALRDGDEIRVGSTSILFHEETASGAPPTLTEAADPAPELTRRERDVLLALCRPVLAGTLLTEPASVRTISEELFLTDSSVKKHLLRLYDKFGLQEPADRRRGRLANEAIRRGAVRLADLRNPSTER